MSQDKQGALYAGEQLRNILGWPTLFNFLPAISSKPLVVFIPGGAHNARVVYGGHPGYRKEDFLAYWLNQMGFGVLALSYPVESTPEIIPAVAPGFRIQDWGKQAAKTTKRVVEDYRLSGHVILLAWSMGGKILEPFTTAATNYGLSVDLFISLAATPGLQGLRGRTPQIARTAANYATYVGMFEAYLAQLHEQNDLNGSRDIIDDDIYLHDYFGHTPICLTAWGLKYSDQGDFIEDKWDAPEDSRADNFGQFPIMAAIHGTSLLDIRHVLADKATWGLMLTYKLLADVKQAGLATFNEEPQRLHRLIDLVHSAPEQMTIPVDGNHFFFVGEKGARETADAIGSLMQRAEVFEATFKALLRET
jgi:hypothetical protein